MKYSAVWLVFALAMHALAGSFLPSQAGVDQPGTVYTVPEGYDYATRHLRDAWDMSQFDDINQWLNRNGMENALLDIQVQDGVFSARTASGLTFFFVLYGGYAPAMHHGNTGELHPISTSTFSCFYMAMGVNSSGADSFQITWGDEILPPLVSGTSHSHVLSDGVWKLYSADLSTWSQQIGTPWADRAYWQSLRITPSILADTSFAIDWVRLTNCNPILVSLTSLPPGSYALWVTTGSPLRSIRVVDAFSPQPNGSYPWDVQGLAPGNYGYQVKTSGGSLVQSGELNVLPAPLATFTRPSPVSGPDYATRQGNAWDMEPTDFVSYDCANYTVYNGILSVVTQPPGQLPPHCVGFGANEADPRIFLNTPDQGDQSIYRYLTVSANLGGAWNLPELGTIGRLYWRLDRPGADCIYGTRELVFDVGWHVYAVDLYDAWNGTPVDITPADCPLVSWRDQALVGPLVSLRFDPNENVTLDNLYQEFDWLRLSQVERVTQGAPYELRLRLNVPPAALASLEFYYTTTIQNPTQQPAERYTPPAPVGSFFSYLPVSLVQSNQFDPIGRQTAADIIYPWDTSQVNPGEYLLCARANDGFTVTIYCSEAPVQVVAP